MMLSFPLSRRFFLFSDSDNHKSVSVYRKRFSADPGVLFQNWFHSSGMAAVVSLPEKIPGNHAPYGGNPMIFPHVFPFPQAFPSDYRALSSKKKGTPSLMLTVSMVPETLSVSFFNGIS